MIVPPKQIVLAAGLLWGLAAQAQVIYVDADATGAETGSNWADAYTDLQSALAWATAGWEIWVAEGQYTPTSGSDRAISFVLPDGVAVYGGFDGTENTRDERDWETHESILSGDVGIAGDSTDNSFHVVVASGVSAASILDGLYIEDGNGNQLPFPNDRGAGLLALTGSPTIRNSTFRDNTVASASGSQIGGAIYIEDGSATVEDCLFKDNIGLGAFAESGGSSSIANIYFSRSIGGGVFVFDGGTTVFEDIVVEGSSFVSGSYIASSSPTFRRVTFRDNHCGPGCDGGALYIDGSSQPYFEDSLFEENTTGGSGGAVHIDQNARPTFVRTVFRGNAAGSVGGAIAASQINGFTLLVDCLFERNTALNASALSLFDSHGAVINSVFSGNRTTLPDGGGAIDIFSSSPTGDGIVLANSLIVRNRGHLGGGLRLTGTGTADVRIVNTTIAFNEAVTQGGGVYSRDFNGPQTEARFENVVIWGNTAPDGAGIYWEAFDSGPPTVTRSIVQEGYAQGTDILDADPLFVRNPHPGPDGNWGTADDDYGDLRLRDGSPAVDYGLQAFLPADIWDLDDDGNTTEPLPIDLNGDVRVQASEVDLGPYEGEVIVANEPEAPPTDTQLTVYPNPASEHLTIETDAEDIEILDVLGRVVLQTKTTDRIDVSGLSAGVYFVRAEGRVRILTIRR